MNRTFTLLWTATLVLAFGAAGAQEPAEPMLPDTADDAARDAVATQGLPAEAAEGLAIAQDNIDRNAPELPQEATMRLMEDDEDSVTHDVELPDLGEDHPSYKGLSTAADAIAGGRSFGEDRAAAARDNAAEAAENARDNVENRGRAEDLPVDVPGRPDMPDLPDNPGRP